MLALIVLLQIAATPARSPVPTVIGASSQREAPVTPTESYRIVFRDGRVLLSTKPVAYQFGSSFTLIYPPNGQPFSVRSAEIDDIATAKANGPRPTATSPIPPAANSGLAEQAERLKAPEARATTSARLEAMQARAKAYRESKAAAQQAAEKEREQWDRTHPTTPIPSPTATPTPTSYVPLTPPGCKAKSVALKLEAYLSRFNGITSIASTTPRVSLSVPLTQMVQIRSDVSELEAPSCADAAKKTAADYMGAIILSYQAFQVQDEGKARTADALAKAILIKYRSEIAVLLQ